MFSKSCCNAKSQRITDRKKKAIDGHIVIVVSGKTLSEVFFLELDNISFYFYWQKNCYHVHPNIVRPVLEDLLQIWDLLERLEALQQCAGIKCNKVDFYLELYSPCTLYFATTFVIAKTKLRDFHF